MVLREGSRNMFCGGCGNNIATDERFCSVCGQEVSATPAWPTPSLGSPSPVIGIFPETSGKAIGSLISGIFFFFVPFSIVAIIFGHLSLSEIRRSAGRLKGRAWAIGGLILGYAGVAVTITVIVAIFIFRQSAPTSALNQQIGTESSAVAAVRTLNTAEIAYSQAHPALGYTCSLSELAGSWGMSGELAGGQKNGYIFKVQGCKPAKTNGPIVKYHLLAYPAQSKGGTPAFCSNESDVIKVARNGSPQDCLTIGIDLSDNEINHPQGWSKASSVETAHP